MNASIEKVRNALLLIERHHIALNQRSGRAPEDSFTISCAREGLAALEELKAEAPSSGSVIGWRKEGDRTIYQVRTSTGELVDFLRRDEAERKGAAEAVADGWQQYRRSQIAELRPYIAGEALSDRISVSAADRDAGSPKPGDMIARNPKNHDDQWLVAAKYFADNFEPLTIPPAAQAQAEERGWLIEHSGELPGVESRSISWLCVQSIHGGYGKREFGYTCDANKALRFSRKEDAEAVLAMHLGMSRKPDWYTKPFSVTEHVRPAPNVDAQAQAAPEGLPIEQEPKYTTDGRSIINRASGEAIPADEPVFIFRARDRKADTALSYYANVCTDSEHVDAVRKRRDEFRAFAIEHPDRMKEPDTGPQPKEPSRG